MRLTTTLIGAVLVLVVATGIPPGQTQAQAEAQASPARNQDGPIALVGGTLIDGVSDRVLRNAVVLMRDGRIERVGVVGELAVPQGYRSIDTDGHTVMPGLWDMHVHLLYAGHTNIQTWHQTYTAQFERDIMPATARQMLMAGVTSVRDLGAPPEAVFAVKARIASGELDGPRIYAAGPQLTHVPPPWAQYYRLGVSGAADATAKTVRLLDQGADVLKVTDAESMAVEEISAITAAAHARGTMVSAHGRTDAEIRVGLDGGIDDFQHIGPTAQFPSELMSLITGRARSGRPLYWTPTVGLSLSGPALADNPEVLDHPDNFAGLPPLVAADVRASIRAFRAQAGPREAIVRKVAQLREAGVQLLLGTDAGLAGNPHAQATWQEMHAWVSVLGIGAMETIQRATSGAARYLGVADRTGSIEAGKVADVIVVPGDPLRHIEVLRDPVMVFKSGRQVK
jgi:imidazolonepropionase-like amidohydrolase